MSCFHLALPSNDLKKTKEFYHKLGFDFGRESDQFLIMNFFDNQVVFHKSHECPPLKMYPRHYGLIVEDELSLHRLYEKYNSKEHLFEELFHRYEGTPEEHKTFFLKDPSNNLIEFKWYKNKEKIFG